MKADISRHTFDPTKRYSGVLMQQGRVQLDAEWNEQQEIHQHRAESTARDAIGAGGVPMDAAGFEVTARGHTLYVGKGRIYVDGIPCVNDDETPVTHDETKPPDDEDLTRRPRDRSDDDDDDRDDDDGNGNGNGGRIGLGLVYLDVWERHVTHLDDGRIREVALGGPDTTTRKQTVWRAKVAELEGVPEGDVALLREYAELRGGSGPARSISGDVEGALERLKERCDRVLGGLREEPDGALNVKVSEGDGAVGRCQIPPGGGYERLENQLYRVEIHQGGDEDAATFKWSRDNGSILTGIEDIDVDRKEITVKNTGRDDHLNFARGQWVEVVDDRTEQTGRHGPLLRISENVDHTGRVVTVEQEPPAFDEDNHPKLRRWDQGGASATEGGVELPNGWSELEDYDGEGDGIEVRFSEGEYRTGDYWLVPARTATGDVEWPREADGDPAEQPPHGVKHAYGALAVVVSAEDDGGTGRLLVVSDYRHPFPPLTRLTALSYLGGDGQEAMPGQTLPGPLLVRVATGGWPVSGVDVRFEVVDPGQGTLTANEQSGRSVTATTDRQGIARCDAWQLDGRNRSQQVSVSVVSGAQSPVLFTANLSVASQVAYDPSDCQLLADARTVQEALDELCRSSGGPGQEPGFHVEGIFRLDNGAPLRNGGELWPSEWMQGLRVVFDKAVEPETVVPGTCFGTVELPWPLTGDEDQRFGTGGRVAGFQPLVLRSTLEVREREVLWRPTVPENFVANLELMGGTLADQLLARFTLKGNFLRARGEPDVYLDGDTFGDFRSASGIRLPTGDGRRGGDFEIFSRLMTTSIG